MRSEHDAMYRGFLRAHPLAAIVFRRHSPLQQRHCVQHQSSTAISALVGYCEQRVTHRAPALAWRKALRIRFQRIPFPEVSGGRPLPDDFTIGRMFRQLIGEENQHFGQIAYLRGLQRGLDK